MEDSSFSALGDALGDAVREAIATGDYSRIKYTVADSASVVVKETTARVEQTINQVEQELRRMQGGMPPRQNPDWEARRTAQDVQWEECSPPKQQAETAQNKNGQPTHGQPGDAAKSTADPYAYGAAASPGSTAYGRYTPGGARPTARQGGWARARRRSAPLGHTQTGYAQTGPMPGQGEPGHTQTGYAQTGYAQSGDTQPDFMPGQDEPLAAGRNPIWLFLGGGLRMSLAVPCLLLVVLAALLLVFTFTAPQISPNPLAHYAISALFFGCTAVVATAFAYIAWQGSVRWQAGATLPGYKSFLGLKHLAPLDWLSKKSGKHPRRLLKELQLLMREGYLPDCYFDPEGTCLIAGRAFYAHCMQLRREHLAFSQAGAAGQAKQTEQAEAAPAPPQDSALAAVVAEGERCIAQIQKANDALQGVQISEKLRRLERVTAKIFEYVQQHPQKLPQIRRFMEYYLPTTLKLVNAYREFDAQPIQGDNIKNAKCEIAQTLDTVNGAFETLLDALYLDDTVDIAGDISALRAILAQEGLTEKDF